MASAKRSPDDLREIVKVMRELGVTEWGDVKLGEAPGPPPRTLTKEELEKKLREEQEKRDNVLFAATSIRPRRT